MILLIDNKGPFTYNLFHLLSGLKKDVEIRDFDNFLPADVVAMKPEALIISSGPSDPDNLKINVDLVKVATGVFPILGIGLGMHAIALAHGGKLDNSFNNIPGREMEVIHDESTIYEGISSPMKAGSFETNSVDEDHLPDGLMISSHTVEGEIMGIRSENHRLEGVQFHPESLMTLRGGDLLENFLGYIG